MKSNITKTLCAVATLTAVMPAIALATLPDDVTVTTYVHEELGNTSTPLLYAISFNLKAVDEDGNDVAWYVSGTTIMRNDTDPNLVVYWVDDEATIDSVDNLWWVTHDDPNNPVLDEFVTSPPIYGTAEDIDSIEADMNYDIAFGGVGSGPGLTADTSVFLEEEGDEEPEVDDDDGEDVPMTGSPIIHN